MDATISSTEQERLKKKNGYSAKKKRNFKSYTQKTQAIEKIVKDTERRRDKRVKYKKNRAFQEEQYLCRVIDKIFPISKSVAAQQARGITNINYDTNKDREKACAIGVGERYLTNRFEKIKNLELGEYGGYENAERKK